MKSLVKLSDTADFIIDGKAVCDLYNSKGGLYAIKGTVLPSHRQKVEFFVRSADFALYSKTVEEPDAPWKMKGALTAVSESEYTTVVETFVPHETIELYKSLATDLSSIFDVRSSGVSIMNFAEDLIEKTFNENKVDLYLCNKAFASFNLQTARHSFSVYLLFCEVMFDFRKQTRDLPFYTTFKQRGKKINFSADQIRKYAMGALLHDIGKIKIPTELLEKSQPLTEEEMDLMKSHSRFGIEILDEAGEYSPEIREMIGNHHQAYPVFKDIEPSPLVEILAMIDIFDACRTERPYKHAFSFKECEKVLYENKRKFGWSSYLLQNVLDGTLRKFESHYQILQSAASGT